MASKTFSLFSLTILLSLLNSAITEAQGPTYNYEICSKNKTTSNSAFQTNLKTLFSSLTSNATAKTNTEFYNSTVTGRNSSDSVYGLFMCRGDFPSCGQCVVNATQRLSSDSDCALSKRGVIWYDECMVRYSDNRSMFSTVATRPGVYLSNSANISNQESFMKLLFKTMNETADVAVGPPVLAKKYATKQANISGFQTLYCLAQCTDDLSPRDCRSCLTEAINELPDCCGGKQGGRVLFPSCNVRYELYPFYRSAVAPGLPGHVPGRNASDADSRYSEDPFYLFHNCSTNETFTVKSDFQSYLRTLLHHLSSNATSGGNLFKKDEVETVYGLFMCRGDLSPRLCGLCVMNATDRITSECRFSKEAIIWYSHCLLRYSPRRIPSDAAMSPVFKELNTTDYSSEEQNTFTSTLSNTLSFLANHTGDMDAKYKTQETTLNPSQTLYTLAQCTRDLSSDGCGSCLNDMIGSAIPWAQLGSVGGRVLYPSCNLRFELFQFYRDGDQDQPPKQHSPSPLSEQGNHRSRTTILIAVFSCVSGILLFLVGGYYLFLKKARRNYKTILKANFGDQSVTLEPLQFEMTVIKAATNNFSPENRIGRGGFGEVYKGVLLNGQQIAVKRLSKSSKQGDDEFKNEVLLIAKLQHKNLVTFIGFCLEEYEKILIYEYVPNKSLDYFLFGVEPKKILQWVDRYNIIGGIARGILYLHEYSRLKVIHRDLKPSNILLDETMIPKISDFGLARIVEINQDQGNTNRIVGTYGYMSPEYAMLGQFSEKSDVYSFGVMVLEIITEKKNVCSNEAKYASDGLLSYVWRYWRDGTPLSILDQNIKENYSKVEAIKCIQIGLLCVQHNPDERPTMASIVSYLANHSIELPTPQEPAFFLHSKTDPKSVEESSSSKSVNTSRPSSSTNQMSLSTFIPR